MQQALDFTGEELKNQGILQAAKHAEEVAPGWNKKAMAMLLRFLRIRLGPFLMEDFRAYAEPSGLPTPPHLRAYGSVALKAAKLGLIKKVGITKVNNPKAHQANATIWVSNKH